MFYESGDAAKAVYLQFYVHIVYQRDFYHRLRALDMSCLAILKYPEPVGYVNLPHKISTRVLIRSPCSEKADEIVLSQPKQCVTELAECGDGACSM